MTQVLTFGERHAKKSVLVREIAERRGVPVIDIRLSETKHLDAKADLHDYEQQFA